MKQTILILFALCQVLTASADFVTEQQAREKATAYLANHSDRQCLKAKSQMPSRSYSAESLILVSRETMTSESPKKAMAATDSMPCYYIFNTPDSTGFVIVSAESTTAQILAYSNEGYFHFEDIDKGAEVFLNQYENDVQAARSQALTAEQQAYVNAINKAEATGDGEVLLETAALSQEDGYWSTKYSPMINGSLYAPAGCVATAAAIIMKFYGSPSVGKGEKSYTSYTNKLSLSRDFSKDTYDWSKIPTTAYSAGDWSDESSEEIGKIMLAIGIACKMDYEYGGSGATTPNMLDALVKNFSYAVDYNRYISRNGESLDDAWTAARSELAANRPVIVSADGLVDGLMQAHCFVMDGYNSNDNSTHHYNMGWGGANNGWYTDGAISSNNLSVYEIITGIQPATGTRNLQEGTNSANQTYTVTDDGVLTIKGVGTVPAMASYITSTILECKLVNCTGLAANAFKDIKFSKITVTANLYFVGSNIFGINENLDSIKVAASGGNMSAPNNKYLYNTATKTLLAYCQNVSEITFPDDVTTIGTYACAFSKATEVTIPSTVTTIKESAFYNGQYLAKVSIPETVTSIENTAFAYCGIKEFTCNALYLPNMGGSVFLKSQNIEASYETLYVPYASVDMYKADTQWGQFQTVAAIGGTEDMENKYLVTADLTSTGAGTLSTVLSSKDMTNCRELVVKGELNGLDIAKLRELTPSTATLPLIINLKDAKIITDKANPYYSFTTSSSTGERVVSYYTVEADVLSQSMFKECNMTGLILPSGTKKIGIMSCPSGLVSLELPEGLTTIQGNAIPTSKIITMNIPASVTTIGEDFLISTYSLQTLTVASGNTHYKSVDNAIYTISGDSLLLSYAVSDSALIVPEGVKVIGTHAFNGSTFQAVTLPSTIEKINGQTLNNFYMQTICCKATNPPTLAASAITTDVTKKAALKVYVPAGSKAAYQAVGTWSALKDQIYEQGDLDADGKLSAADITRVVKVLNTADYPYSFPADVNNDNQITIEDVDQLAEEVKSYK